MRGSPLEPPTAARGRQAHARDGEGVRPHLVSREAAALADLGVPTFSPWGGSVVTLPPALQTGIDELVHGINPKELERSALALSDAYRTGGAPASRAARTPGDVAAYLATRAPATYAAAADVFARIRDLRPDWAPVSMLDLGAGPGLASWAAAEAWRQIEVVDLVEQEAEMARAGRRLAGNGPEALRNATWTVADAGTPGSQADLVVVSYLIGELTPGALEELVRHAWERTSDTFVIIEPGTTAATDERSPCATL